ncbi:hypothetical protein TNCV_3652681 [Trichonephila clavipes]|nr:hypothetical protein TNCV_3652681 [Trichonephila clavipes]
MRSRTRGRPPTRWIDYVENDLKTLNILKTGRELLHIVGIGGSELWRQPRPVTDEKSFFITLMRGKTIRITREKVSTAQIPANPVNKKVSLSITKSRRIAIGVHTPNQSIETFETKNLADFMKIRVNVFEGLK